MPVASKESIDMAEQMISGEIDRLKFRLDRIEKIVTSLEKGEEAEEPEEEGEEEEEEEEPQPEPIVVSAPVIPDNIQAGASPKR